MSQRVKLAKEIRDLDALKRACEDLDIDYVSKDDPKFCYATRYEGQAVIAELVDRAAKKGHASVYRTGTAYSLVSDKDRNYNSLSNRLGPELNPLFQRYGYHATTRRMPQMGFRLMQQTTREDGALVLRYVANG